MTAYREVRRKADQAKMSLINYGECGECGLGPLWVQCARVRTPR